jgi:hypothetical protein
MNEHCDGCGKQTPVLETFFTGSRFLCLECLAEKRGGPRRLQAVSMC